MNELSTYKDIQEAKGLASETIASSQKTIKDFLQFFEIKNLEELKAIRKNDVNSYVAELRTSGNSGATINKKLSYIKSFYNFLWSEDLIENNILQKFGTIKEQKRTSTALLEITPSKEEFELFISTIKKRNKYYTIFTLLGFSGLRISELCNLKIQDVKSDGIFVMQGKGSKQRFVYLPKETLNLLNEYIVKHRKEFAILSESEFLSKKELSGFYKDYSSYCINIHDSKDCVFLSKTGNRLSEENLWKSMQNVGLKLGIDKDKMHPHALRRMFAYNMANNGGSLDILQEQMGHSSIATTRRYFTTDSQRIKDNINAVYVNSNIKI